MPMKNKVISGMNCEIKEAFNEIMEIPPIYRRDYIVDYLRKNLPIDDARMHLFKKTKAGYLNRMIEEGYITKEEILEKIGREKIVEFFHIMSNIS